jgi:hypothetical protein
MPNRQKGMRNSPMFYDEVKQSFNIKLTPKTLKKIQFLALTLSMSRSEVIEQFFRSDIDHLSILSIEPTSNLSHHLETLPLERVAMKGFRT